MRKKNATKPGKKGLSDQELVAKYETGEHFDIDKQLETVIKQRKISKKK